MTRSLRAALLAVFVLPVLAAPLAAQDEDPLASWNDGASKEAIVAFVERITDPQAADFIPPPERIAVFDNDGTLWSEQPLYFQLAFAMDRVRALAAEHPEWRNQQPFKGVLENDMQSVVAGGERALLEIIKATHAGMTAEEFSAVASNWIETARHPTRGLRYVDMVFQPMLELLAYLRNNGFKTFIVSGGGIEFMRPWAERVYGVPPEQVVGSSIATTFDTESGKLIRGVEIDFIDDKAGKPVGIHRHIGRRPIAAFGNSDGDLEMLQWTTAGDGPRFGLIVHHTDGEREWAYDRASSVGRLDEALDEAAERGWTVVDMARDWNVIYPGTSAAARAGR